MQGEHDQFSGRIAREGDASRPLRDADNERHPGQHALDAALQRHRTHRRHLVFPEQHVMLEIDCIARRKIQLCDGHYLAFDLTRALPELKLRHVLEARRFTPTRLADQILDVQRRSTGATGRRALLVHALAPLALQSLYRRILSGSLRSMSHVRRRWRRCVLWWRWRVWRWSLRILRRHWRSDGRRRWRERLRGSKGLRGCSIQRN